MRRSGQTVSHDHASVAHSADIASFLGASLSRLPEGGLAMVTVPAPAAPVERLWAAAPEAPAVLWSDPNGRELAGLGEAVLVTAAGGARFAAVTAAAAQLSDACRVVHPGVSTPPRPALIGGFAFATGDSAAAWEGFGDARFLLPRWSYERHADGSASLTLALAGDDRPSPAEAEADAARVVAALAARPPAARPSPPLHLRSMELQAWSALVEAARAAIGRGDLAKVVLARRFDAALADPADPVGMLAACAADGAGIYRFGFRVGPRTFLGASPELLVSRRGERVESEAVAGSLALTAGEEERVASALLADPKQLEEHALVSAGLTAALAPLCRRLQTPGQPQVRHLRRVAHLWARFAGELREELAVTELAGRLHPTPAVGGAPREAALAFIAGSEPEPRGWYAGPVGLVDAAGDGAFAVAIRGALLERDAIGVWAGAGIVAASQPIAEYAETELKAHATLAALGLLE